MEVHGCLLASARSEPLTVKRGAIPLPPFCPLLPILSAQWSLSPTGTRALPGLLHLAVAQGLISCSVIDTVFQFFHVDYFVRVSVFS